MREQFFWRRRRDLNPRTGFSQPTPLAGEPLEPLEYVSMVQLNLSYLLRKNVAERVGFEPTAPCGVTGFQDQLLKPLGHLSIMSSTPLLEFLLLKLVIHRRLELRTP